MRRIALNKHALLLVLLAALMPSCVSYERCVARFGRTRGDTILVHRTITVPADSIITMLRIDSIPYMVPGDTVYITDPRSRASIRYWRERYSNAIGIMAHCDTIVVRDTIMVPMPMILDPPPARPPGRLQSLVNALIALGVIVAVIIVLLKIKRS